MSRRLTTGRLIKSLTSFAQPRTQKRNRCLRPGVSDVGTSSWLVTSRVTNTTGPVPLVSDLRISHDRFGSSSDLSLDGHLHNPHDLDRSLNEFVTDKIRQYLTDYNNRPSNTISFMPDIDSSSGCLHSEFVWLLFLQSHRETDLFFADSGVHLT